MILLCKSCLMGMQNVMEILLKAINDEEFVSKCVEKYLHLVTGRYLVFDKHLKEFLKKYKKQSLFLLNELLYYFL